MKRIKTTQKEIQLIVVRLIATNKTDYHPKSQS